MKRLLFLTFILSITTNVPAQSENRAPIVWERYKLGSNKISLLLPKLPTIVEGTDGCDDTEYTHYSAFADGIVYQVSTISSNHRRGRSGCKNFVPFGPRNLERRMISLRDRIKREGEA